MIPMNESYTVIVLLEQTANMLSRKSTTLNVLNIDSKLKKSGGSDFAREFRNLLVHSPVNYGALYTLLRKSKLKILAVLAICVEMTGLYKDVDMKKLLDDLLDFYKKHKE